MNQLKKIARIEGNKLIFNRGYRKNSSGNIAIALIIFYIIAITVFIALASSYHKMGMTERRIYLIVFIICMIVIISLHYGLYRNKKMGDQLIVTLFKPDGNNKKAHYTVNYMNKVVSEGEVSNQNLEIWEIITYTGPYAGGPEINYSIALTPDYLPEELSKERLLLTFSDSTEKAYFYASSIFNFLGIPDTYITFRKKW